MNVRLLSQDRRLYKLCRDIRSESSGNQWHLLAGSAENGASNTDTDLYIWDFDPDSRLSSQVGPHLSKYLFLVARKDVAKFHNWLGRTDVTILLKPITRATLSAFLGLAVSAHADRLSAATGLRAHRDEILQCLIQANLKLQEFDQERTNFLARALHDFRAPLTAISGYCDLLLNSALGPLREDQNEVLRRMNRSAKRLSRMAWAMFQLSIGRHVNVSLDLLEGDIQECVEQALHEVTPLAAGKDISISLDFDPATTLLYFDPGLIEQALVNLLDNACRFTPKSGGIEVRGYPSFWERRAAHGALPPATERRRQNSERPNAYRIDIQNYGPSIPKEHLEDIFAEYTYSGGQDRSGGGLSLAICRMILARHDGRVWAENRDTGPVFSFVLPVRTRADSASLKYTGGGGGETVTI